MPPLSKRSRAIFEADSDDHPHHAPFVFYGTPLPAYDRHARDDGSYVPLWKQEVRDEHGRKRLHGAFTGGWSAGYVQGSVSLPFPSLPSHLDLLTSANTAFNPLDTSIP